MGDDISAQDSTAQAVLRVQAEQDDGPPDLLVWCNDQVLQVEHRDGNWFEFDVLPANVKQRTNRVVISRRTDAAGDTILRDLQLAIRYGPADARSDPSAVSVDRGSAWSLYVSVTSGISATPLPLDPKIDFGKLLTSAGDTGVVDPNSITVREAATGQVVPHSLSNEFHYCDTGHVLWVVTDAKHTTWEIHFRSVVNRGPLRLQTFTPMIGIGDLIHYNADVPRPLTLRFPSRMVDLTGDGRLDLVGTLPHVYAPRDRRGGIVCYHQVDTRQVSEPSFQDKNRATHDTMHTFEFGDMVRLRYKEKPNDAEYRHFMGPYLTADVADVNQDGRPDLIYTTTLRTTRFQPDRTIHQFAYNFLNTGRRDAGICF